MTPEEIKKIRLAVAPSQAAMARALNVPYRTYQDWEAGQRNPSGLLTALLYLLSIRPGLYDLLAGRFGQKKKD